MIIFKDNEIRNVLVRSMLIGKWYLIGCLLIIAIIPFGRVSPMIWVFLFLFIGPIIWASFKLTKTHLSKIDLINGYFNFELRTTSSKIISYSISTENISVAIEENPYRHTFRKQLIIADGKHVLVKQIEIGNWTGEKMKEFVEFVNTTGKGS